MLAVFELVLFMTVPRDLTVHCHGVCHSEGAIHNKACFVITLISLGPQNKRYNEVAVNTHAHTYNNHTGSTWVSSYHT